ncbi:MAG TPA: endopeptidase La [Thermoanaerobaculaceae bacterium]|nr:endopeptidase La [Thermoanaerobaculaceae bacterium]
MPRTISLPVIPLREAVLFPGVTVPIGAGRPATLAAIEVALAEPQRLVFVSAQRENAEEASPDILYTIGTIARIMQVQRGASGMQLVLQGERRGIALRIAPERDYLLATVREAEELPPLDPHAPTYQALLREARERAAELGGKAGLPREAVQRFLADVDDPGQFADAVAAHLELAVAERQALLETLSVEERLRRVLVFLQRQIAVLDAQEEIKSKVQEEIGGRQREIYLREQLKAIQKELGGDGRANDADALREKLAALPLPEAARKEVDRELGRLERMAGESMEAQVIRTYLETIAELPWGKRSEEHLDLARAAEILERDHFGLGEVKDRILEFLAVRSLRQRAIATAAAVPGEAAEGSADDATKDAPAKDAGTGRAPILLFVGPPGVGKTSVAQSIARAMGREYVRISLGGARDEADIRGHRRTYVGAMPGRIIQGMKQAGTKNPVFLLDEVDKLGVSYQGDPSAALLEVLDPAQNDSFTDHYLGVPFDLGEVLFIATANFIQSIPGPLLDRMEVVEFSGYTEGEKLEIAKRFLVPRQLREAGLAAGQLAIGDAALAATITGYTREAGVRQLEREIGRLARKVARRIAAGEIAGATIDAGEVERLLGRPKVHPEHAAAADQIGVATGMFYTPVGGDIMFVEATTMRGKGELVLTGQLGDVMKESARAAWSYAKAHADELGIEPADFEQDVHIHVPAGAIPKDGPSAGVTMSVALVSALASRPARHDLAMTGEITLSGRVLPIGGVKEKVLGAVRAGITTILLPKANEADLEDLPAEVRKRLGVLTVEHLDEVLATALRGASLREGRLTFADADNIEPFAAAQH